MRIAHFLSMLAATYAGRKPDAMNNVQSTCKLSPDLAFPPGDNQATVYPDLETTSRPDVNFLESDANEISLQPDLVPRSDKQEIVNTSQPDPVLFESGKGTGHDTTALDEFEQGTSDVEKEKILSPDTGSGADQTTSQYDLETTSRPDLDFLESDENKTIQPHLVPRWEKQESTSQPDPVLFESDNGAEAFLALRGGLPRASSGPEALEVDPKLLLGASSGPELNSTSRKSNALKDFDAQDKHQVKSNGSDVEEVARTINAGMIEKMQKPTKLEKRGCRWKIVSRPDTW